MAVATYSRTGVVSSAIIGVSIVVMIYLAVLRAPIGLAAPSTAFEIEAAAITVLFALSLVMRRRVAGTLKAHASFVPRLLGRRAELPSALRALALAAALVGLFVFAFFATADVLGGYNGYSVSFSTHPFLPAVFNALDLRYLDACNYQGTYLSCTNVGTQASLFLLLAILGVGVLRINRGLWTALKDSVTLFAAPILLAFELALWYSAPDDMSWHALDALSLGGAADGGWRLPGGGGAYLVSNWLVLFVSLLLISSRIQSLAALSK